jgi:membrane protease YdiL (CAAX protease family)
VTPIHSARRRSTDGCHRSLERFTVVAERMAAIPNIGHTTADPSPLTSQAGVRSSRPEGPDSQLDPFQGAKEAPVRPRSETTAREVDPSLRPVIIFLVCAFGLSWLAFLPLILDITHPESTAGAVFLPLLGIGAPTLTAFVLVARKSGWEGIGRLWRAGVRWRTGARWYAIVLILPGLAFGTSWLVTRASSGDTSQLNPLMPAIVASLLAGVLEEYGWSGFAFPRLQARFGFLRAGIVMGFVVAFWHLPLFFTPGQPQSDFSFLPFLLTLIAVRILFGWVYNGSGGSVLLTVLLHASGSEVLPLAPPSLDAAWLAEFLVFGLAAAIVVVKLRGSTGSTSFVGRNPGMQLNSTNLEPRHG